MPLTVRRADGTSQTVTGTEVLAAMAKHDLITESPSEEARIAMADELFRVYIDDATGNQIASPADARNGGSRQLQGEDAKRWLAENPDRVLVTKDPATKEADKAEDKAAAKAENKAKS